MAGKRETQQEVGDLFVTETTLTLKLLPSKKMGTSRIKWFAGGNVTNATMAAKDIAALVGRLQGRSRVVKGVTVMTHHGAGGTDLEQSGLQDAVEAAGLTVL